VDDVLVREVLLIDDDEVSRELLLLFVAEAGFQGIVAESGDDAMATLKQLDCRPYAVLADMQMHGITGNALARELRRVCGGSTRLIAMSGSHVPPDETRDFDGFLLKPFTVDQLCQTLEGVGAKSEAEPLRECQEGPPPGIAALNEAIFSELAKSMPLPQLLKLYSMCLEDAERRIGLMRAAAQARDPDAYRSSAHAIKGGCGMVGATEMAALAGTMEQNGLPPDGNIQPIEEFLIASARLRRILDARVV
jgi:CheY-like chemotaxis protein